METTPTTRAISRIALAIACLATLLTGLFVVGGSAEAQSSPPSCSISKFWLPDGAVPFSSAGWGVQVEVANTEGRDFNVFGNGLWLWSSATTEPGATSNMLYPVDLSSPVGNQHFIMQISSSTVDCGQLYLPACVPATAGIAGATVCGNEGAECSVSTVFDAQFGHLLAVTTEAFTQSITLTTNGQFLAASNGSWGPRHTTTFDVDGQHQVVMTAADGTWWDCGTVVVPSCTTPARTDEVCSKVVEAEPGSTPAPRSAPKMKVHPLVSTVVIDR